METHERPSEAGVEPSPSRRRPVAVTFVGFLAVVVGLYHIGHGVSAVVTDDDASRVAEGALDLALGVLALAIAVAVLRLRKWAWVAFMTWALVGLTHQLLRRFFYGDPDYLAMALDAVVVLALTPLDVQLAFGVRPSARLALDHVERNPGELD